jgi:lysylphosphatidylglycerol synthetase-like protein (DUF2156 family)
VTNWRRATWLPQVAGLLTAAVGVVNVLSALTPELGRREVLLARVASSSVAFTAHAFVLPAGWALLVLSVYLAKCRRRALWLTVSVLAVVGGLELLKGLDVEEALASWTLAGLLSLGRDAFPVRHGAGSLAAESRRVGLVGGRGRGRLCTRRRRGRALGDPGADARSGAA